MVETFVRFLRVGSATAAAIVFVLGCAILTEVTTPAASVAAEGPPRIVAMTPAVGATNVDPATSEIVVTFDRDMMPGFSWTGGGPEFPPIAHGKGPYWRNARMAVLPVKLEPGHYYS